MPYASTPYPNTVALRKLSMPPAGHAQEAALAAQREEHEASLQDIDEWCRGEIEAVQHNARVQAVQAHEAVEQW